MIKNLLKLWRQIFPVSEGQAIKIAMAAYRQVSNADDRSFQICNKRLNLYPQPQEPCWYVFAPWGDGLDGAVLRSSRVIAVSKITGAILYDDSAGDEG